MKRSLLGIIIACSINTCLMSQESLQQEFDAIVSQSGELNFSGIVVVEREGSIIANCAFGIVDEETKAAIDSKTLFEIGSVTKPVTALAAVILERQGKLSLEDSIADYLPEVPDNCREITVRDLVQHTSGIPGDNYGPISSDLALVTKAYLRGGPKSKPGTQFEYWNQGYALLAAVIAKVSGQSYQDAIRSLVFEPAKMNDSCFTGDTAHKDLMVSTGKATNGADRSALDHPYGDSYGLQYQGMGGIVTNAEDMIRFVRAVRKSKASTKRMLKPGPDGSYGLGWHIERLNETQRRIHHSGSVRGFLAAVSWYPETSSSIVVLANTDDKKAFWHAEANCRKALELKIVELPENERFDDKVRKSLVGKYVWNNRVVIISESGQGLELVIDWGGPKTFGKLATTGSRQRLRLLDSSDSKTFVTLGKKRGGKVGSIKILNDEYVRKR